jgi:phosphatidate cytidylyltransferase
VNKLLKRSITGVVYVVLMIGGVSFHPLIFAIVFGALLFFTQKEFYRLMKKESVSCPGSGGLILGVMLFAICFGTAYGLLPRNSFLIFVPALIFIFLFDIFKKNYSVIQDSAITLMGFIYIAVPFSLMNFIVFPGYPEKHLFYPRTLIGIFFITWIYDTFAFLSGSLFGKHKIHDRISPQKTWEGLITGTVFAMVMAVLNAVIFNSETISEWLIIAIFCVIAGTLGDFFESKIKREINVKDSGNILPGHGGLLDRLDSLLFIIPAIFAWLALSGNLKI